MKSARARWRAHRTLGATRRWTTTGYATAQWKARSARRCQPPPGPTLTNRNFFSFCGGPNPCPLDQSSQAKHHHFDPRKQTPGGRHQIGTPAGFKSESVAGFLLECVAGFVGIRRRTRHPFCRHQSEQTQRPRALRGCLLPARPGRKSYQIMEDPSGGGSHFLHEGDGQSASAVPACRRVLVDVGASGVNAETFDVARRPVRHIAPTPDQDRRTGRRDEDDDPGALAHVMPRAGYFALRSRTHTAPRHLKDGACAAPSFRTCPVNPQTLSAPNSGSKPEPTRRVRTYAKSNEITRARR